MSFIERLIEGYKQPCDTMPTLDAIGLIIATMIFVAMIVTCTPVVTV